MLPQFVSVPMVYANISSTVYTHVPTLEALRAGTAVRRLFKKRQKAAQLMVFWHWVGLRKNEFALA